MQSASGGATPVHNLSQREIYSRALELRAAGKLFPLDQPRLDNTFKGSVSRFCEIAFRLRGCRRVLDVGAGQGMLLSLLSVLGHECYAMDIEDPGRTYPAMYAGKNIASCACNVEVDPFPYADGYFDATTCCQVMEHFTHSHLPTTREMFRVLRPGGIIEIDVPNAVSFRSRSRMLRGKHITWDYEKCYLRAEPILYKGMSFFPNRHNREFTRDELELLLRVAGFEQIEVSFLKSRRHREGLEKIRNLGTALKDTIPSLRKSLIAFARKP